MYLFLEAVLTIAMKAEVLVTQSCPAVFDPKDYNLCPWDSSGKHTGVDCHSLLQGIFLTQRLNSNLLTSPALAGEFFTTSTIWEAQKTV